VDFAHLWVENIVDINDIFSLLFAQRFTLPEPVFEVPVQGMQGTNCKEHVGELGGLFIVRDYLYALVSLA
jgi:hypothetical protein